jgi:CHC2 zinc finger
MSTAIISPNLYTQFLSLLERHVKSLCITGHKARGLAPCHDDHSPSFSANLEIGQWFCHSCQIGGGVKKFASLVGEAITLPSRILRNQTSPTSRCVHAERRAIAAAEASYQAWNRQQFITLTDRLHELHAEIEVCEIVYRAAVRRPDLYTREELGFWTYRLGFLYDSREWLHHHIDWLTDHTNEKERLREWAEEVEHGQSGTGSHTAQFSSRAENLHRGDEAREDETSY